MGSRLKFLDSSDVNSYIEYICESQTTCTSYEYSDELKSQFKTHIQFNEMILQQQIHLHSHSCQLFCCDWILSTKLNLIMKIAFILFSKCSMHKSFLSVDKLTKNWIFRVLLYKSLGCLSIALVRIIQIFTQMVASAQTWLQNWSESRKMWNKSLIKCEK